MTVALLAALALGAAYGLVGVAVAAVALASRTLHLAVGAVLVAGVLIYVHLTAVGAAPLLAAGIAVAAGATVSALLEPLVLRPLGQSRRDEARGDDVALRWLVALAVVAAVLDAVTARTLGTRHFRPRPLVGALGDAAAGPGALLVPAAAGLVLAVGLAAVLRGTRFGRRVPLVGAAPLAAALGGISPRRVRAGALALTGAAAVVAGLLLAPVTAVGTAQTGGLTVRGVAAAAVLGIAGPARAVAGGLLLGAAESAGQSLWPAAGGTVAVAAVIVAVLVGPARRVTRRGDRPW
ncbi:MAG: hypothetical protein KY462_08185 [Actinobacteria bacterium]|nr:hypothetical protein [Actinomycetota bacterium]